VRSWNADIAGQTSVPLLHPPLLFPFRLSLEHRGSLSGETLLIFVSWPDRGPEYRRRGRRYRCRGMVETYRTIANKSSCNRSQ